MKRTMLILAVLLVAGAVQAQKVVSRGSKSTGIGVAMTVHGSAKAFEIGYDRVKMENAFVIVDVTIEGIDPNTYVSILDFYLRDKSGALYPLHFTGMPDQWESGYIGKGQKKRGKMAFELPDSARGLEIIHRQKGLASRL